MTGSRAGFGMVMLLATALALVAEDAPPRTFTVARYHVGPQAVTEPVALGNFYQRLAGRPGIDVVEAQAGRTTWYEGPQVADGSQPLSLVSVVFGKRQNWLVLQSEGPEKSISLAAWRQALPLLDTTTYSYLNSVPPGPDQIAALAMIELAAEVGQALEHPRDHSQAPLVGITVEPWRDVPETAALGDLLGDGSQQVAPSQPADGEALTAVQALALAAAWELGVRPRRGAAPEHNLRIRLSRTVQAYGMQVTWEHPDGSRTVARRAIPETMLYHGLKATLRWAMEWGEGVDDIIQIESEGVELLLATRDRLHYRRESHTDRLSIHAVDRGTLLHAWDIPKPDRGTQYAAAAISETGEPRLYMYQTTLQPILMDSGQIRSWRLGRATHPWGFFILTDREAVSAWERHVRRGTASGEVWLHEASRAVDAGPIRYGESVIAGSQDGTIFALDLGSGEPLWSSQIEGEPAGPMLLADDRLLVRTWDGRIAALDAADGSLHWQRDLGDALIGEPWVVGDRVVVAWGNGRLATLRLSDGETVGSAQHPVLLRGATAIPVEGRPRLAAVEPSGAVVFYSVPELQLLRRVPLGMRPVNRPLFVPEAPQRWATGDPLADLVPQLLVPDYNGLIYCLAIP